MITARYMFVDESTGEEEYREFTGPSLMHTITQASFYAKSHGYAIVLSEIV